MTDTTPKKTPVNIALANGTTIQVEAFVFGVTVGNVKHRFALHQIGTGAWRVSCPKSGRRVMDLNAYVKGMPVHSRCLTAEQALATCRAQVQAFTLLVGGDDEFNRVVLQTQAEVAGAATC